jgi:outer membrane immunogenic protein
MLRISVALTCLAGACVLVLTPITVAHAATPSMDRIMERLDALERENATLRKRVQRLEAVDRERPVLASVPGATPRGSQTVMRTSVQGLPAIPPAAGAAYAATPGLEQPRSWTGAYLGVSAGMRREDHKWTTNSLFGPPAGPIPGTSEDFNDTGARVGGFAGYNFHVTSKVVLGIEGDFAWGATKTSTQHFIPGAGSALAAFFGFTPNDSSEFRTGWDASLRARLGALITPDTLAYVTGGAAWQQIRATASCDADFLVAFICGFESRTDTQKKTLAGWTLGGGIETTLANAWTGLIESRYSQFNDFNHLFIPTDCCDGNLNTTISLATHTFSAGLAYRFGAY